MTVHTFFVFAVKTAQDVVHRYRALLKAYKKNRSIGTCCQVYDIDRATIALTAVIAEVHIVAETEIPEYTGQTLKAYAQQCKTFLESQPGLREEINQMKKNGDLLPVPYK